MLNTDQIQEISKAVVDGKTPKSKGPGVAEFVRSLKKDIKLAKKKGWTVELPFDP